MPPDVLMTWMKRTLTIGILAALTVTSTGHAQQEYTGDTRSADDKKLDLEIDTNVAKTPAQIQAKLELLHTEIMMNRMRIEDLHQLIDLLKQQIDIVFHAQEGYAEAFQKVARGAPAALQEIDARLSSLQWQINALRLGPIYRVPMKRGWESEVSSE
jgi:TolA-binding protein